jgi:hypothetical protein
LIFFLAMPCDAPFFGAEDEIIWKEGYWMSVKGKTIRKTAPIFGAAATAGLLSMMGMAMADVSDRPVTQIALSDDAVITVAQHDGRRHRRNVPTDNPPGWNWKPLYEPGLGKG